MLDRHRVAVLPFVNITPDPADEYFADGMTEELISTMSKIRDLSVISRTSVMQYKNQSKPITEIGTELNAGTVLEGSVRKAGNRVRVSAQMIDAINDKHVWAENYDRELQDIFSVQSDIASRVAEALKVQLLAGERQQIGQTPTKNPEAHVLYLKAIYHENKGSPADFERAIEYYELAVEQDPQFALAYAQIALLYVAIAGESMPGSKAFPKAKENLASALSLNPTLAEAQNVNAWIAHQYDWNWTEAEASFKKTIAIMPSLAIAHDLYGRFLAMMGRFEDAISEVSRAHELDPADPFTMFHSGIVYWMAGRNDTAREFYLKVLVAKPHFARAHLGLACVNVSEVKRDEAIREADAAVANSDEAFFREMQAWVHGSVGSTGKVREILANIQAGKYTGYVSPFTIGAIYYMLGDQDKGYEWVKKAYDERDPGLVWYNKWPILGVMREDERFVQLLHKMKLP
jgi:TolB-like protein/Tfp pilus assembly protein PilF